MIALPNTRPLRPFFVAAITGWVALAAAGAVYARQKGVEPAHAAPIIAAFLAEYFFYLVPGFEPARNWIETRLTKPLFSLALWASALAPYLIFSTLTEVFDWRSILILATLTGAVSFWYTLLRPHPAADAAILVLIGAVLLSKFFTLVYQTPIPPVRIDILGKLMLLRVAAMAMLSLRKVTCAGYGFIPNWFEIRIGLTFFLYFIPVGFPLALAIGLIRFNLARNWFFVAVGTFFGILWVVALLEEFLFRALLQQWIKAWSGSRAFGLIATSVVFGLCHLTYQALPNWKFAAVAAVAGLFYGAAYERAGGIRAAMVTHALVVAVWRTLFA